MNTESKREKTLLSWSSGKDSAWSLHVLRANPEFEIAGLFTTVNEEYGRVSMHGTSLPMLARQAKAVGLPLHTIPLPNPCPMEKYSAAMRRFVETCIADGIEYMAFGDLFLTEIRDYREKQLEGTGIAPLFPLWGKPTDRLAEEMLSGGLRAYVSSVDLKKLPARFVGREWSRELLAELPDGCDPCGENGEIHTVVTGGPMFRERIQARVGEIVERDGFAYADIVSMNPEANP
jgi:uncharacterized protein (TIGR00290 family)